MNESKATPGPWEWVEENGYHYLVGANGVRVHSDGSACGEYGPDINVAGPDANLIAAAPELLAACQAALPYLRDHIGLTLDDGPGDRIALDMCEDAIAKATGGES